LEAEIHPSARSNGNFERRTKMNRNKIIPIFMAVMLLAALFAAKAPSTALAATGTGTLGSGTIVSISLFTDPVTKITTGVVTLIDETGASQKITISLETAVTLKLVIPNAAMVGLPITIPDPTDPSKVLLTGILKSATFITDPLTLVTTLSLVVTDATLIDVPVTLSLDQAVALGLIIPDPTMIGTAIVIDPTLIVKSITYVKGVNTLENYFGTTLGLTADELTAYRAAGFGYGEIAQACWMATQLGGNASLLNQILMAKQSGDFSAIVLPDGSTAANWGQLRKAVLTNPHQNFGQVMSGHAAPLMTTGPATPETNHGNGNGHGNGNANGHGNNKGGKH
jgi:hypothetical protein